MHEIHTSEEHEEIEELNDCSVAHIANFIETRIKTTKQFSCALCKHIFEKNAKVAENVTLKTMERPCHSTFSICKQTERFMKKALLTGIINFSVIYHEILANLDFETLFFDTDFTDHSDHKIYLIRYIVLKIYKLYLKIYNV